METTLVTKTEAARLLGVSRRTILRLVHRGVLDEVVLGPRTTPRLRLADIVRLVEPKQPEDCAGEETA